MKIENGLVITEPWMVRCINLADGGFGYGGGPFTVESGLDKAVAKSMARHLNKAVAGLDFVFYFAEEEPRRYW